MNGFRRRQLQRQIQGFFPFDKLRVRMTAKNKGNSRSPFDLAQGRLYGDDKQEKQEQEQRQRKKKTALFWARSFFAVIDLC
jgi:hypothetical protein